MTIAQRHGLPELLARVLAGRGVEPDEVEAYLDPSVRRLMPDPHVLTAMEAASARIADAVTRGENVAIFGDYDVDGATASALLARYLRQCGLDPIVHIPDRIFEGYGPNVDAIRSFAERGVTLLVTVDCGTTSHRSARRGKKARARHRGDRSPPGRRGIAAGFGNRQSQPRRRPLRPRSARRRRAGVSHAGGGEPAIAPARFLDAGAAEPDLLSLLHLVALGTVADVVPLDRAQPRLRRQGADRAAPPRSYRRHRADGRGAAVRPARALASRLSARAAHQCRRPHRPRRSRRAAVAGGRPERSGAHRRRARPAQHASAAQIEIVDRGASRGRSLGRARARG